MEIDVYIGQVAEEEVRSFVCQRKPELQDHPLLVAALGGHLRLLFHEAKMEAVRRASDVSPRFKSILPCHLADNTIRATAVSKRRYPLYYACMPLLSFDFDCRRRMEYCSVNVLRSLSPPTGVLSQVSAGSVHERVNAFESTFGRKYLTFQLHCRGVQALRQARRRHTLPGRHPTHTTCLDNSDPVSAGTAGATNAYGSDTPVDVPDPDDRAEAYLLETKGAELAEIVTARECQKLVRRHSKR